MKYADFEKTMSAKRMERYLTACGGDTLPNKLRSSRDMQYNQTYVFNELDKVNSLRNRIAHHETICFATNTSTIDTSYVINIYSKIKTLFSWMDIDSNSLLYGLDHINRVCAQINKLKAGI